MLQVTTQEAWCRCFHKGVELQPLPSPAVLNGAGMQIHDPHQYDDGEADTPEDGALLARVEAEIRLACKTSFEDMELTMDDSMQNARRLVQVQEASAGTLLAVPFHHLPREDY